MMKKIGVALFLSGFLFFSPWVSAQPTQSPSNQQTTASRHKENFPKKPSEIRPVDNPADDRIANYTFWLTVFTGLLFAVAIIQLILLRRAEAVAKASVEAANATANAMIASERAYIFFEIGSNEPLEASQTPLRNELTVKIWNVGKTPAETIEIESYSIFLGYTPQDTSTNTVGIAKVPQGYGISTNNCMFHTVDCYLSNSDLTEIREGRMNLFVVCRITYRDILGEEYTTSNCWFYKPDTRGQRWLLAPDCKLNYRT